MKNVIHIEDKLEWRQNVHNALMLNTAINPVISYECIQDFRDAGYPSADLYVCDRHLPERRGEHPNDESWKQLFQTIDCLHPGLNVPVVILSSHPPKDWRTYSNVVEAIRKPKAPQDFDFAGFRCMIENYLGLNFKGDKI